VLGVSATVSFIPITTTVIVVVVANTVTSPSSRSTLCGARFFQGVLTLAHLAVFIDVFLATAVSAIPVASAVVVVIVTVLVAFPAW